MQEGAFDRFVDKISVKMLKDFNEKGSMEPTWYLQQADGKILLVVTPYEGDLQKDFVDFAIREAIAAKNIQRYAHISEVWMVVEKNIASLKDYKGKRPSERPDRKEAVMFIAEDISGEAIMSCADIYRDPKTDLAMIADIKIDKSIKPVQGRFVNMFKKKEPLGSPHN